MSLFGNQQYNKKDNFITKIQRSIGKNKINKFHQINDNSKTQKKKEKDFLQKIFSEREKNFLAECYFSPRIIKNKNVFRKKPFEGITQEKCINNKINTKELLNTDSNVLDLINRQNKWLENKKNKLNHKIDEEEIKTIVGCVFKPEIKKVNKIVISNLKIKSDKIVEKPDSYINYVKRNIKFRENKKIRREYKYPISKNWKSPHKNKIIKTNNYDYTKHELTENSYLFKNKNSISNKSFKNKDEKKTKSTPICKLKITNISNNELYSMIYLSGKEKIEKNINDYTEENAQIIFGKKKKINFRLAMEGIHKALINLNLSDINEDEILNKIEN